MKRSLAMRIASPLVPRPRFVLDGIHRIRPASVAPSTFAQEELSSSSAAAATTSPPPATCCALVLVALAFGGTVSSSSVSSSSSSTTTLSQEAAEREPEDETGRQRSGACRIAPCPTTQPSSGPFATSTTSLVRPTGGAIRPSFDEQRGLPSSICVSRSSVVSCCEGATSVPNATTTDHVDTVREGRTTRGATGMATTTLSWWHRAMHRAGIVRDLPLPRIVGPNDPDLVLTRSQKRRRQQDENRARQLQQQLVQLLQQQRKEHDQSTSAQSPAKLQHIDQQVAQVVQELYGMLYGDGVTPQSRQEFLERYGCTGWTDGAIDAVLRRATTRSGSVEEVHQTPRGLVEIGAGHGQWARHITDQYNSMTSTSNKKNTQPHKPFDIVLAYDDGSSLPLNTAVYHRRTRPHRDHFYDRVQPCPSIKAVLSQWQCRGRVLLLVYPPPDSDMARDALLAYASVDGSSSCSSVNRHNDTVIYVGEGRGGANASDSFFDVLESGQWILEEIVEVQPMGSKGYERMYIFTRSYPNLEVWSSRGQGPTVQ